MWYKVIVSLLFISLSSMCAYAASDETTSDLIAIYDDAVYVPSQEEMSEFARELQEYQDLVNEDKRIKEFNAAVDDSQEYQRSLVASAQESADKLLFIANNQAKQIEDNIYGDILILKQLDTEYKSTLRQVNKILLDVSKFSSSVKLSELDVNLDEMKEQLDAKQQELTLPKVQRIEGEYILGEVYNVQSPVDLPYVLESNWGARLDPLTKTSIQYHNGIDIQAPSGTIVKALFNGRVLEAGDNWALGNYIRIQHGSGVISIYAHLSEFAVKSGEYVEQYQVIGKSGSTGNLAGGENLHLGLFINGRSVDPSIVLKNAK